MARVRIQSATAKFVKCGPCLVGPSVANAVVLDQKLISVEMLAAAKRGEVRIYPLADNQDSPSPVEVVPSVADSPPVSVILTAAVSAAPSIASEESSAELPVEETPSVTVEAPKVRRGPGRRRSTQISEI